MLGRVGSPRSAIADRRLELMAMRLFRFPARWMIVGKTRPHQDSGPSVLPSGYTPSALQQQVIGEGAQARRTQRCGTDRLRSDLPSGELPVRPTRRVGMYLVGNRYWPSGNHMPLTHRPCRRHPRPRVGCVQAAFQPRNESGCAQVWLVGPSAPRLHPNQALQPTSLQLTTECRLWYRCAVGPNEGWRGGCSAAPSQQKRSWSDVHESLRRFRRWSPAAAVLDRWAERAGPAR